jgi:hypothetical protein
MLAGDIDALDVAQSAGGRVGQGIAPGPAREVIGREALPDAVAACEIVSSTLGTRIGDVAAPMAALTAPELTRLMPPSNCR